MAKTRSRESAPAEEDAAPKTRAGKGKTPVKRSRKREEKPHAGDAPETRDPEAEPAGEADGAAKAKKRRGEGGASIKDDLVAVPALLDPGMVIPCRVGKLERKSGSPMTFAPVQVAANLSARLRMTEIANSEDWVSDPLSTLKSGTFIQCVVLEKVEEKGERDVFDVSMRRELLELAVNGRVPAKAIEAEKAMSSSFPGAQEIVKGFVERVDKRVGLFVRVSRAFRAIVPLPHMADKFIKDPEAAFPIGTLVAGRVLLSDPEKKKLALSLRSSNVVQPSSGLGVEDLKPGVTKIDGIVNNVTELGLFIDLVGTNMLRGLCHVSEIEDGVQNGSTAGYARGDRVRALVMKVQGPKRISLSLKPSHFKGEDDAQGAAKPGAADGAEEDGDSDADADSDSDAPTPARKVLEAMSDSDDDEEEAKADEGSDSGSETSDMDGGGAKAGDGGEDDEDESASSDEEESAKGGLSLQAALKKAMATNKGGEGGRSSSSDEEDGGEEDNPEESGSESEGDGRGKQSKKSSLARQRQRRREEAETAAREQARLADDQSPQSADDYERLLLGMPNSSLLWIQYMAFQTAQTEVDQARVLAERALKTINYRMEEEKQNVWFALMELEYKFGTPEAVQEVIKRMLPQMNRKHAYFRIADMYAAGGELDKADEALRNAVKAKKGTSKQAWLRRIELKFTAGDVEGAKTLLQAAVKALPPAKHMFIYLAFARLEFSSPEKGGSRERARTMCEELVSRAPKRNDVWHQYIDLEIKFGGGNQEQVRNLFKRATSVKLSVKKIKAFFKKWLVYENAHGTEEGAETVKALARAYVQALTTSA